MQRRFPSAAAWRLPPGLSIGLLMFLVVFTTGVTEPFGLYVANAAHWGGLLAGATAAALWRRPAHD
jgi:membrane associated rhomboid family serine protease